MHRFFISETGERILQPGMSFSLPDKLAHQVRDVLHLAVGERLLLLDNSGDELTSTVTQSSKAGVQVHIVERNAGKGESPVQITLCQGMLKSARFELILEKGTELGVSTFAPVLCQRSLSGLENAGPAKIQRWQHIIQEAAEQCDRARLPKLLPIRPLQQALEAIPADAFVLMPWEEASGDTLRAALQKLPRTVSSPLTVFLFIGPEGGLERTEVELAQKYNAQIVTLGPRILRAETAALATVANVMYQLEEQL